MQHFSFSDTIKPFTPKVLAQMFKKYLISCLLVCTGLAHACVGLTELPPERDAGLVTVFYPCAGPTKIERRGDFALDVAIDARPTQGNGRLVVISHGSPASPWVYYDLARSLVNAGFIVALPEHFADNYKDDSEPGPRSWKRRPFEVSKGIDRLAADKRFQTLFDSTKVGMYGMSAGGHTALALAGGRWSPAKLRQHCEAHIAADFQTCAGPTTTLKGDAFDGIKIAGVRLINRFTLTDATWYGHTDPRITAVVAGVPFAADFDPASLQKPPMPLGIITARLDRWLSPTFHSEAILKTCQTCERLADLKNGAHGALLSPLPPMGKGIISQLVADPPGFNRATEIPKINDTIVAFFVKHLVGAKQENKLN
jgi:predicted dienelactone hydrolase